MRIVRASHERFHAHVIDQLTADAIELEGALALPLPYRSPTNLPSSR
jgi:hypothetical protein